MCVCVHRQKRRRDGKPFTGRGHCHNRQLSTMAHAREFSAESSPTMAQPVCVEHLPLVGAVLVT